MQQLNYELIVDKRRPDLNLTPKRHVDMVVKEVKEALDQGELQVKIEELPNAKYAVSMTAQLPHLSLYSKKEGKKIIPLLKKVKKTLLRRLRGKVGRIRQLRRYPKRGWS